MSQAILAILTLVIVTTVSLQQRSQIMHDQFAMIRNEAELQATSVAVDRLEEIGAMAFDEKTRDGGTLAVPAQLSGTSAFGPNHDAGGANDHDDFHGDTFKAFRLAAAGDTLWFSATTQVAYASELNPDTEVAGPTKYKKVTVEIESLNARLPVSIELAQTFECGSECAW